MLLKEKSEGNFWQIVDAKLLALRRDPPAEQSKYVGRCSKPEASPGKANLTHLKGPFCERFAKTRRPLAPSMIPSMRMQTPLEAMHG